MITVGDIKKACSKLNDDTPVVIVVKSGKHLMQPEISTIKILPKAKKLEYHTLKSPYLLSKLKKND